MCVRGHISSNIKASLFKLTFDPIQTNAVHKQTLIISFHFFSFYWQWLSTKQVMVPTIDVKWNCIEMYFTQYSHLLQEKRFCTFVHFTWVARSHWKKAQLSLPKSPLYFYFGVVLWIMMRETYIKQNKTKIKYWLYETSLVMNKSLWHLLAKKVLEKTETWGKMCHTLLC